MVIIKYDESFEKNVKKINNQSVKEHILKQIQKIIEQPEIGKPMRYFRKGTREIYIKPFRLSYVYHLDKEIVEILEIYHKKKQ